MSASEAFAEGAGALAVDFFAGAGLPDGVESEALALAFLLFCEGFAGDASGAGAAEALLGAVASAVLDFFEDFFVEVVSADAVESFAAASGFFDFFEDFFVVEVSAAAVESADASASAFFDFFEDFFVVEESAGAEELSAVPESGFLLFFDFEDLVVAELSAAGAELSLASALGFLDFFFFVVVVEL